MKWFKILCSKYSYFIFLFLNCVYSIKFIYSICSNNIHWPGMLHIIAVIIMWWTIDSWRDLGEW